MDINICSIILCLCLTITTGSEEIKIELIEVSVDPGCLDQMTECQASHSQLAFAGLPGNVFSPDELKQQCGSRDFSGCLESIDKDGCTGVQKLDIEGSILAEEYVCSEKGLKQYSKSNEFTQNPWIPLKRDYMITENQMCREKFSEPALIFMANYRVWMRVPEGGEGENMEVADNAKEQREQYCNYMYAYQNCVEQAAERHCNETIAKWQRKVTDEYYTPHFTQMECHIGTGLEMKTIGAIVIASVILLTIFGLALFCGVYEKCGEKLAACRRSKNKDDSDTNSQRESIVYPDKNGGMPQRSGSRVRFEIEN